MRLNVSVLRAPATFADVVAVLPATMLLATWAMPLLLRMPPPPTAEFSVIVLLAIVIVPL